MFLADTIPYWRHFQLVFRRHHTHITRLLLAPSKSADKAYGTINMNNSTPIDLVILGSGMAGLAAAQLAAANGLRAAVFDKGRRIGGRVSTRRANGFTFNHGAQFLTARDPDFVNSCDDAVAAGALRPWRVSGRNAFCGATTMRDFPSFLGDGIEVNQGAEITRIESHDGLVAFHDDTGLVATAKQAVITAPAPQARRLLAGAAPELAATAGTATYAPCWTAMFGFDANVLPEHAAPIHEKSGPVGWGVWEAHRPGAAAQDGAALTVQAAPDWSKEHLEQDQAPVAEAILAAWQVASGTALRRPNYIAAHRWRYARVITAADVDAPWVSDSGRIALAGDWLAGSRVENAWLSGRMAIEKLAAVAA